MILSKRLFEGNDYYFLYSFFDKTETSTGPKYSFVINLCLK